MDGTKDAGLNRVQWNLGAEPARPRRRGGGGDWRRTRRGRGGRGVPFVTAGNAVDPGTYVVKLVGRRQGADDDGAGGGGQTSGRPGSSRWSGRLDTVNGLPNVVSNPVLTPAPTLYCGHGDPRRPASRVRSRDGDDAARARARARGAVRLEAARQVDVARRAGRAPREHPVLVHGDADRTRRSISRRCDTQYEPPATRRPSCSKGFDERVAAARARLAATTDPEFLVPWTLKHGDQEFFTMPRISVLRTS